MRRDFSQHHTARTLLRGHWEDRRPPILVPEGVLKVWFAKQSSPPGTVTVSSAAELQERHGDVVRALAATHASAYKLCRAMLTATPPAARHGRHRQTMATAIWSVLEKINSAGHLEMRCGDRIREGETSHGIDVAGLRLWLRENVAVDVSEVTCRTWLSTDWSSSGKLLSIAEVERSIRERLRLPLHAASFSAAGARWWYRYWRVSTQCRCHLCCFASGTHATTCLGTRGDPQYGGAGSGCRA